MKKAFVTGVTGQDGSYLAELLLSKGYEVHALRRQTSTFNTWRIDHIYKDLHDANNRFFLYYGDLTHSEEISAIIYKIRPNEVYHLGAQSQVRISFDNPTYTGDVTGLGTTRLLEAIRMSGLQTKFYQASSSEMFGDVKPPLNEKSLFSPRSPYACAKVYAFNMVKNYRDGYGLFGSNGILFNHESPRRGETFVTRKVTRGIASILAGRQKTLYMGNTEASRDWGYAPEYVEVMWKMLQQKAPGDYVIGTGEAHTVKEFIEYAFEYVGLDPKKHIVIDKRYYRPTEVEYLVADASKARKELGFEAKVRFKDLVRVMVDADMRAAGLKPVGEGDELISKKFPKRWWKAD